MAGVGLWPQTRKHKLKVPFEDGLRAFGYGLRPDMDVPDETVIQAFQRHFRPVKDRRYRRRECKRILAALLQEIDFRVVEHCRHSACVRWPDGRSPKGGRKVRAPREHGAG